MPPVSTPVADKKVGTVAQPPQEPPDEQFWVRYSPHHEFPLSTVTSVALHVLVIVLLGLAAWVAIKLGLGNEYKPVPVTAVTIPEPPGGASGPGTGPGPGGNQLAEDTTPPSNPPEAHAPSLPQLPDPSQTTIDPIQLPKFSDPTGRPVAVQGNEVLEKMKNLDEGIRKGLFSAGGPGGGHQGSGTGNAEKGSGSGDQPGKLTERQKRLLRWRIVFNTQNGNDYLNQLQKIGPGSGAILAYPAGDGKNYYVIRDLSHPSSAKMEDVRQIQRIFWIDDRLDSVAQLARAIGIKVPTHFFAFFPAELEKDLARIEKEVADKDGIKDIDDIYETRFEVVRDGDGYRARVVSVTGSHR